MFKLGGVQETHGMSWDVSDQSIRLGAMTCGIITHTHLIRLGRFIASLEDHKHGTCTLAR